MLPDRIMKAAVSVANPTSAQPAEDLRITSITKGSETRSHLRQTVSARGLNWDIWHADELRLWFH
jgi:hypothetical protein